LAVIKPGPTTARKSRIRIFCRLRKLMGKFREHINGADHSYDDATG
jgi:hypothetical protein